MAEKKKRPKSGRLFGLGQGREETRREKQGAMLREKEALFFSSCKVGRLRQKKIHCFNSPLIFFLRASFVLFFDGLQQFKRGPIRVPEIHRFHFAVPGEFEQLRPRIKFHSPIPQLLIGLFDILDPKGDFGNSRTRELRHGCVRRSLRFNKM
jgi:hypothetical protein